MTEPPATRSSTQRFSTLRFVGTALGVFTLLTMVHTWPLMTGPGRLSCVGHDARLNEWIVAWVAHQLPRDPMHLFEANVFHPAPHALAFSEPLIPPGIIAIPLRWAGASVVLAYNVLLLLGFILTGVAGSVVIADWTGDRWAGLLAGSTLAFNTQMMTHLDQLQAIQTHWLLLALWALDRLFLRMRTGDALWLALFVVLAALTSGYLAVFTLIMLGTATLMRAREWWGARARLIWPRLALAAAVALLVAVPILWPYRLVHGEQGLTRTLEEVSKYSASPLNYLVSTSVVHYGAWSHYIRNSGMRVRTALFPGVAVSMLAMAAVWWVEDPLRRRRVRMCVGIGGVAWVLSMGTNTPIYAWVYHVLPPMQGLRFAARFGRIVLLVIGLLAGCGLAEIRRRLTNRRWALAVALGGLILVNVEALHAPMRYQPFDGITHVYRRIAEDPGPGAVVEFPFYARGAVSRNAEYVLASTEHWRPLLNGYSGFIPEAYDGIARTMRRFPSDVSVAVLRSHQVRFVVVHSDKIHRQPLVKLNQKLAAHPELAPFAEEGDLRVYTLSPAPQQAGTVEKPH